MDLVAVSEEVRTALAGITGLRRPAWGVEKISPPAAIVALPGRVEYDETYGRGKDRYPDLTVVVLAGRPDARTSRAVIAAYANGSGPKSVKATLEAYAWTTCDLVVVKTCEFDATATYSGVNYLAAIFTLDIIGKGA